MIDASALFTAFAGGRKRGRGRMEELWEDYVLSGDVEAVVNEEILHELAKAFRDLGMPPERISFVIGHIRNVALVVEPKVGVGEEVHPKDRHVVSTALTAGAEYIVTYDERHLLRLGEFKGVKILKPLALLRLLRGEED